MERTGTTSRRSILWNVAIGTAAIGVTTAIALAQNAQPPPAKPGASGAPAPARSAVAPSTPASSPAAADGLPAVLVDAQLAARRVTITAITENAVSYRDEQGRERRASIAALAGLMSRGDADRTAAAARGGATASGAASTARSGAILLADGQRFPGQLMPSSGEAEQVVWSHPVFGPITVALDRVARLAQPRRDGAVAASPAESAAAGASEPRPDSSGAPGAIAPSAAGDGAQPAARDRLILVNGDELSGFLIGLGNPAQIDAGNQTIDVPADRIAGAELANPRMRPRGVIVWLADGTVAMVERAASAAGELPGSARSAAGPEPSHTPGSSGASSSGAAPVPQAGAPRAPTALVLTLPGGQSGRYDLADLRGIAFDASRVWAISSLPVRSQRPLGERRWAAPMEMIHPEPQEAPPAVRQPNPVPRDGEQAIAPGAAAGGNADAPLVAPAAMKTADARAGSRRLAAVEPDPLRIPISAPFDAYDLFFPGPMAVTFDLPEKAERAAGTLELDPRAGAWADCEAAVLIDGSEVWRARLARNAGPGADATAAFNTSIPGGARTLTIAIEPGRYGPVMDQVFLRGGLVMVGR